MSHESVALICETVKVITGTAWLGYMMHLLFRYFNER